MMARMFASRMKDSSICVVGMVLTLVTIVQGGNASPAKATAADSAFAQLAQQQVDWSDAVETVRCWKNKGGAQCVGDFNGQIYSYDCEDTTCTKWYEKFLKKAVNWFKRFSTTTTTPPPTTTSMDPVTIGNTTCFRCDNGIQKDDKCKAGSMHQNWDMDVSSRCKSIEEFFHAYDLISTEFKRRYLLYDYGPRVAQEFELSKSETPIHLCASISVFHEQKRAEAKVIRDCVYGTTHELEMAFFDRFNMTLGLKYMDDNGVVGLSSRCVDHDISVKGTGETTAKVCCNDHAKCNYQNEMVAGEASLPSLILLFILNNVIVGCPLLTSVAFKM